MSARSEVRRRINAGSGCVTVMVSHRVWTDVAARSSAIRKSVAIGRTSAVHVMMINAEEYTFEIFV